MTGRWRESARERIAQRQPERHRHRPEILEDRDELAMSPRPDCYPVRYRDEHDRGQLGPSTRYYAEPPQPYADELDDFDRHLLAHPAPQTGDDEQYQIALSHLSRHARPHISPGYSSYMDATMPQSISTGLPSSAIVPVAEDHLIPTPRTLDIINREPNHRFRELYGSHQQPTPPMHSAASYAQSPASQASTKETLHSLSSSSPTIRASAHKKHSASRWARQMSYLAEEPMEISQPSQPSQDTLTNFTQSTPIVHGIRLVSVRQALPSRFQEVFPYELLNAVQSKCFGVVYGSTDNVVVSAPTGSGKTAILELAICKLALDRCNENFKIVYQAPTKALCSEKARDWEKKFSHMGLKCAELTGDTSQAEMRRVGEASIIVTTPEKWDSITRKWQDHRRLLQLVELFLIDEVHILKDVRGATLEAVVSRMKTIGANVRFVALSATVPNSDDIAKWLGRNHTTQQLPAYREVFGEEFRPVKLQKFVYGYECNGNDFIFDRFLDGKLPTLLSKHNQRKPTLIFCFTRKSCESTATKLAEHASGLSETNSLWPIPTKRIPVLSRELQEIVRFGVAFHHAGLDVQDRIAIEQHFLNGELSVICCTSTLAVGVNLPCHTVVMKGTVAFMDDKLQEYSDLEIMQMLGRAGRPQFDTSATAIILTRAANKLRYENMVSGREILESTLHLNLIEHLNSEICLGTIGDLASAKLWLGGTFLSVRLRRNPDHYRLTEDISNPSQIDDKIEEICERDIKLLQNTQLVTADAKFKCTEYGRAMSKYMVEFETMKLILKIPRAATIDILINALAEAVEFKEFRMKPAERTLFREINKNPLIMYPVKEQVQHTQHKISLIVQLHLGSVQYPDSAEAAKLRRQLIMEKKMIFERLQRLIRAVIDCKGFDRDAPGVKNALDLARALSAESWEGRPTQLTQIPNIGPVGMRKLASQDIRTVLELAEKESVELERLMSRQPPFGKKLKADLNKFPRLDLDVSVVKYITPKRRNEDVTLNVQTTLKYLNKNGPPNWLGRCPMLTFMIESSNENLLYFWRGSLRKIDKQIGLVLPVSVPLKSPDERIICHLSCEEIVGTLVSKVLKHEVPLAAFPSQQFLQGRTSPANGGQTQRLLKETAEEYVGDDGIDDSDLLQAAEEATSCASVIHGAKCQVESDPDEYPEVEELMEVVAPASEPVHQEFDRHMTANEVDDSWDMENSQILDREPVQLPNGRWQCNHACSGGAPTKSGKPCTHKCCQEGLEKHRKRPTKKRKKTEQGNKKSESQSVLTQTSFEALSKTSTGSQATANKTISRAATGKEAYAPVNKKPKLELPLQKQTIDGVDFDYIDLSYDDDEFEDIAAGVQRKTTETTTIGQGQRANIKSQFSHNEAWGVAQAQSEGIRGSAAPSSQGLMADQSIEFPLSTQVYGDDPFDAGNLATLDSMMLEASNRHTAKSPFSIGGKDQVFYQTPSSRSLEPAMNLSDELVPLNPQSAGNIDQPASVIDLDWDDVPMESKDPMNDDRSVSYTIEAPSPHELAHGSPQTPNVVESNEAKDQDRKIEGEPEWVSTMDTDVVDMLRGFVTFV
ncbi:P-loop containing nucleoside triphosphate hydrolase protein [Neurospora crassa]|nr:P-loop containing nucleoside triphosphate hydrolase protein [Neurospora crassa]